MFLFIYNYSINKAGSLRDKNMWIESINRAIRDMPTRPISTKSLWELPKSYSKLTQFLEVGGYYIYVLEEGAFLSKTESTG